MWKMFSYVLLTSVLLHSFTVSLHIPNWRHMFAVRAVQETVSGLKTKQNKTKQNKQSNEEITQNSAQERWIPTLIWISQSQKDSKTSQMEAMPASWCTVSHIATMLRMCSSLVFGTAQLGEGDSFLMDACHSLPVPLTNTTTSTERHDATWYHGLGFIYKFLDLYTNHMTKLLSLKSDKDINNYVT